MICTPPSVSAIGGFIRAGASAIAAVLVHAPALEPSVRAEFVAIGHEGMRHEFWAVVWRAVFAGWLIALLVSPR
ncbi:MAG TPA: hypothetical protein VK986_16680, partial [Tepidisphaeraceae bacterium]|nr:hypothetical protein [Tepidisphaeraceae bacterium]